MADGEVARWRGWAMLGAGLFLIAVMGTITLNMWPMLDRPGVEVDGSTFTGTAEQAQMILGLFGLVLLFGFASTVNGVLVLSTGRQSNALRALALAIGAVLIAVGWAVRRGYLA